MTKISPEVEALSIVVVGRFNPAIFHPLWFSKLGIFSDADITDAADTTGIVHRDIADFQIDWCRINVTENRFMASTRMDAYFERLQNLVYASFEHLSHTPVKALGINPEGDFSLKTEEKWHEFGHKVAPKEPWQGITQKPGLQELIIKDGPREGDYEGYSHIKLRPSEKIEYGLYIQINDHFELGEASSSEGTKALLDTLETQCSATLEKWQNTYEKLMSLV